MSQYRDEPQPSFDELNRHYDSQYHPGDVPAPTTTYGPGGNMYNRAAMQSVTDLQNEGPYASAAHQRRSDQWLDAANPTKNRSKWIVLGSIAALLSLVAIGVTVGVVVSRNHSNRTTNLTNPNNPSSFVQDPRLHKAFYGMAYTPANSLLPNCGNSLSDVIQDMQLISQLTTRIRLYGADCNQSALVLEAIKQTKVDVSVYLGNYAVANDNGVAYQRQRELIKSAIQTYGTDHIAGVTVGNEFMLNYLVANANAQADPNGPIGNQGAAILIANIQDTRTMLSGLSLSKTIPVGTSDAGSYFNTQVLEAVDYGLSNVHPWFANVSEADAAAWTASFFQTTNVDVANALPNKPKMYIAETGWPTKSSDKGNESNGPGHASIAGLQTFLNTFICQANQNGTGYFFFEFFDETWKDIQFGGVEGWWGLFTADRKLKGVTIPSCTSP